MATTPSIGFYIGVIVLALLAPKIAVFGYLVIAVVAVLRARGDSTPPVSTTSGVGGPRPAAHGRLVHVLAELVLDHLPRVRIVSRVVLLERQMARFLRKPVTVRNAARTIVATTAVIVVASGLLMRVLDHREYPNVFIGMWWAIQTVTTVGYGDVAPRALAGRIVAAAVMLEAIALVAIVTAAVTSTFVTRSARLQDAAAAADQAKNAERIEARFDDLTERIDRLGEMLRDQGER